jgi:hypothetical protein
VSDLIADNERDANRELTIEEMKVKAAAMRDFILKCTIPDVAAKAELTEMAKGLEGKLDKFLALVE